MNIIGGGKYSDIMRTETAFYNGYMYQVTYKRELSNNDYTQHHVYHIKTNDESYPHAHTAIESIMNDGSWREGYYQHKNKTEPSMLNAFHPYHKFSFDESLNCFVYTLVIPYDD